MLSRVQPTISNTERSYLDRKGVILVQGFEGLQAKIGWAHCSAVRHSGRMAVFIPLMHDFGTSLLEFRSHSLLEPQHIVWYKAFAFKSSRPIFHWPEEGFWAPVYLSNEDSNSCVRVKWDCSKAGEPLSVYCLSSSLRFTCFWPSTDKEEMCSREWCFPYYGNSERKFQGRESGNASLNRCIWIAPLSRVGFNRKN